MGIEVGHNDDRVTASGAGECAVEVLAKHQYRVVIAPVDVEITQLAQGRMLGPDLVQLGDIRRKRSPGGLGGTEVAGLIFVLLVVDVLFGTGPSDIFVELVPGVDAPTRRGCCRESRPDLIGRRPPELEELGEDVRRVDKQIRPKVGRVFMGDLGEELLELGLGVSPGEVGIRLLETGLAEGVHHRRSRERFREEDDVGKFRVHLVKHPLPELQRLGVRVVHPEDRDTEADPVPDDSKYFVANADRIVIEVDRVDVLVLLRRILRVGDRSIRKGGEPLGVLDYPGVVGRTLQREVESDLEAVFLRGVDKRLEVLDGAEIRMDGVMPAVFRSDGPRGSRIVRSRFQRVIRTLPKADADRMDWRQVDHVEAHACDGGETACSRAKSAARPGAILALLRALRPREELVPAAGPCPHPLDAHLEREAQRGAARQRPLFQFFGDSRV